MNPIDYGDGDYGDDLGSGTSELDGGETRLSLRERFDQLEPKQRLWLLVGVGVLLAIGGVAWWTARQRAKGKCKPVLEWTIYNAKVVVEQCPVGEGFIFMGAIPEQKVDGVAIEAASSPALASTDAVRQWAKATLQERLA